MSASVVIAALIGPILAVAGIGFMLNQHHFKGLVSDISRSSALLFLTGMLSLAIGTSIILFHNLWVMDWRLIITLIGWAALIKGAFLMINPKAITLVSDAMIARPPVLVVQMLVTGLFGAFLSLRGFGLV